MTCERLINDFLMDYASGNLPLARKLDFEVHLGLCPQCRRYLATYRRTIALAKDAEAAPAEDPPEELIAAILKITRG